MALTPPCPVPAVMAPARAEMRRPRFRRSGSRHALRLLVLMNGPMGGSVSGGDVHAARLVREWADRFGDGVSLVAPAAVFDRLGLVGDHRIPITGPRSLPAASRPLTQAITLLRRTAAAVWRPPPSAIVVASSHLFQDTVPAVALRLWRGSHFVTYVYHLIEDERPRRSVRDRAAIRLERLSIRLIARFANLVFVDRVELLKSLSSRGVPSEALVLTANAYDPQSPMPPRYAADRPLVLFCGRLVHSKGVWDVLALAEVLLADHPDVEVVVAGDGPERAALRRAADERRLTNIQIPGFVDEDDKWKLLRTATLFIAPSREEGWGIAVGEALWAGTPVVAYDLPAYRHFGESLVRVPHGDTAEFVRRVLALLDDPACLGQAEEAARGAVLPTWSSILRTEIDCIVSRCT